MCGIFENIHWHANRVFLKIASSIKNSSHSRELIFLRTQLRENVTTEPKQSLFHLLSTRYNEYSALELRLILSHRAIGHIDDRSASTSYNCKNCTKIYSLGILNITDK